MLTIRLDDRRIRLLCCGGGSTGCQSLGYIRRLLRHAQSADGAATGLRRRFESWDLVGSLALGVMNRSDETPNQTIRRELREKMRAKHEEDR